MVNEKWMKNKEVNLKGKSQKETGRRRTGERWRENGGKSLFNFIL